MKQAINKTSTLNLFDQLAMVLIENDSTQDYDVTAKLEEVTHSIIAYYNLDRSHLQDLLELRDTFEKRIDKQYKIKRATGAMAVTQDMGAVLKSKKVPQKFRVMNGLMDSVIGTVFTSQVA